MLELSTLRTLFQEGALRYARIIEAPLIEATYNLECETKAGKRILMTVARSDGAKTYKSIDAAIADTKRLGFKEVILSLS